MFNPDLRPLGIGEILDRAVTVFVRRFAVLILIVALVAIPVAICQYIAAPQTAGMIEDLRRVLAVPPGHTAEQRLLITQFLAHNQVGQWGAALLVVGSVLSTLSGTACVIAIGQSCAGRVPSVREVYREALRRWLPQLIAIIAFIAIAVVLFFAVTLAVVVVGLAIGAIGAVSTPAAVIVGIPVGLVAVLGFLIVVALLSLSAQLAFVSIALEDPNPIRGIAHGFRRTLGRSIFWRSLLVATIAFVVSLVGGLLIVAVAGALSALTHVSALYPVIAAVGSIILSVLLFTFMVIYSIDIRVRREGYDLVLAAQAPAL